MGRLVEAYFDDRGNSVRVSGYDIAFADGSHGGLVHLADELGRLPDEAWPDAIAAHFEELADREDRPATWDAAAPNVRLRLYPDTGSPTYVTWPITDGLVAGLAIKTPSGVARVAEIDLTDWHVKPEIAFDRALHNTTTQESLTTATEELEDGGVLSVLRGSPFVSAHVFVLERHVEEAPHGALVALPSEDVLILHVLRDYTVVGALNAMHERAVAAHQAGPGSITPMIYWWEGTDLTPLPATTVGDRVSFATPDRFSTLLGELAASGSRRRRLFGRD